MAAHRYLVAAALSFGLTVLLASCGGSPTPTLTGIAVQPHSILTWPDQLFTAVGVYSDHSTGPLKAQVIWGNDAWWVRIDELSGGTNTQINVVCLSPAPLSGELLPQPEPANITATATLNGQTFSSSATLYCH